jgi:hypothetical protein
MANSLKDRANDLDAVRRLLLRLAGEKELALMPLSLAIGRNHAYLQQFVTMKKPRVLPAPVREALGKIFGVHPNRFLPAGAPPGGDLEDDPDLLRAIRVSERICGTARDEVRARVTAAAYALLRRERMGFPLSLEDDGTLLILQSLFDGLWQHFASPPAPPGQTALPPPRPTVPPPAGRREPRRQTIGDVSEDEE